MKKIFSFIAILSLLLMGCEGFNMGQAGKVEDLFSAADLAKLDGFPAEGGSVNLPFTPDFDWEASANRSWIGISPERGTAGQEMNLKVSLAANPDSAVREGTVFVELANGIDYKIQVRQLGANGAEEPILELVDGRTYDINKNGGNLNVTVRTNIEYNVVIPANAQSWLTVADTRAIREDVLTFTALKNDSGKVREAKVSLTYADGKSLDFYITQEAADQGQEEEQASISVSPKTISIGAEGGLQSITVTSNAAWSVTCNESNVSISPRSGSGNGSVTVSIPAATASRSFSIDFEADNGNSTAKASVAVSQSVNGGDTGMTPGEHQDYLEQTGLRLLTYFNPEDSRALATSIMDLVDAGGFDFYLEEPTRSTNSTKGAKFAKKLGSSVLGVTRFSPEAAVRLSTTLILPWEDGEYNLNDYKGKQYIFNYQTGKWAESVISSANEAVAIWGTSVATLTWVEGTNSWEGFINYEDKAKVENIPSAINLEIKVNNRVELSTVINISVPTNYSIETQSVVSLNGGYNFSVTAKADRRGVESSVVVSKGKEKLATAGGQVLINDMTDSQNWFTKYTEEWFDGYEWHYDTYNEFNIDYPINNVKTGSAYATILDIGLNAQGDLRKIIDEGKKIENISSYDGSLLLSNYINSNASALLYYTGSMEKIADIKAEPVAYEDWYWDDTTNSESIKTYYDPMPVLVFTDGSKFAVDEYFTEVAFGNLIDAAEALMDKYIELVD